MGSHALAAPDADADNGVHLAIVGGERLVLVGTRAGAERALVDLVDDERCAHGHASPRLVVVPAQ